MKSINSNWPTKWLWVFALYFLSAISGCKKLVDAGPQPGYISEDNVYTTNSTAIAALTSIYVTMANQSGAFTGPQSITFYAGLSADELTLFNGITNGIQIAYYTNRLSVVNSPSSGSNTWTPIFALIFRCNAAIQGLTSSSADALTPSIRQHLLGEAHFMRAFFYFYLVNMYGDVPLVVGTDPEVNILLGRSSKENVYQFIINDLKKGIEFLSPNYMDGFLSGVSNERIRPTQWAARALLSRVYLYTKEYLLAETEATKVINHAALFDTTSLNNVFLKNSKEAIWQLQPIDQNFNTRDARLFVITTSGPGVSQPVFLSPQLLSSFEVGDKRTQNGNWVDQRTIGSTVYRFPFKYKLYQQNSAITPTTGSTNMAEFQMVLRMGEQYLIRSEARANLNNLSGSITDLDVIRRRAGLPLLANTNPGILQQALIDTILHERQVELFTEWGHRWFDLKRTGKIDEVMNIVTPLKSQGVNNWQSYQQLYPILQVDIDKSPNLTQNSGY